MQSCGFLLQEMRIHAVYQTSSLLQGADLHFRP
jgi:hypothetical protein